MLGGSSNQYTVKTSGFYQANLYINTNAAQTTLNVAVYANGNAINQMDTECFSTQTCFLSSPVYLAYGDVVTYWFKPTATTTIVTPTYMSLHLIEAIKSIVMYSNSTQLQPLIPNRAYANALCQDMANYNSLSCSVAIAFMCFPGDEVLNFPTLYPSIPSTAPVMSPNGAILGSNWNNFVAAPTYTGSLGNAAVMTCSPSVFFWTNCASNGLYEPSGSGGSCNGGTTTSAGVNGLCGACNPALSGAGWIGNGYNPCNGIYPIMCACVRTN